MRVLLAGGGTAGHVNPLLSTAKVLKDKGCDVVVLGTSKGIEATLVPDSGFELLTIEKLVFPRRNFLKLFSLPLKLKGLVDQVVKYLVDYKVDVVCGFGGYVCAPAYLAAKKLNIPIVVHEQNAKPGMANKLGAYFADVVALTFETNLKAKRGRTFLCGMPLREEVVELSKQIKDNSALRLEALDFFGLDENKKTLLITGGSLGAVSINSAFKNNIDALPDNVQVVHLCGKGKAEYIKVAVETNGYENSWKIYEYLKEMHFAYACADFIVCRSGAATVAEVSALGIPAYYVPLPIGNGEQSLNAKDAVNSGAAFMQSDKNFAIYGPKDVFEILLDDKCLSDMRKASSNAIVDGATRLADSIIEVGN